VLRYAAIFLKNRIKNGRRDACWGLANEYLQVEHAKTRFKMNFYTSKRSS
jgi:hypothetical protein